MAEHSVWRPFRLSEAQAQARLEALAANRSGFDMRKAFADNPYRVEQLSRTLDGLFVDMSKQKWDVEVLEGLLDLANEADLKGAIADLFGGVKLNATENRQSCTWPCVPNKGMPFRWMVQMWSRA